MNEGSASAAKTSQQLTQDGIAALKAGRPGEAVEHLQAAFERNADNTDVMQVLGIALHRAGRSDDGVELMERSIARNRRNPDYLINLANIRRNRRELEQAEALLRQAVSLAPQYAKGWHVLASTVRARGMLTDSIEYRRRAVALEPKSASALMRLGLILVEARHLDEGLATQRAALALDPAYVKAHSNYLVGSHYLPGDPATMLAEHRRAGAALMRNVEPPAPHANLADPRRRLKIGYVSPDFRVHSVAFFLTAVFAHHGPVQVEVFAYSDVARPDAVTERLRGRAGQWRDIYGLSDDAVATMIRRDGIDVLIDLSGHTAFNRLAVFARKPAPVQVSWLGYPDTVGLPTIDARLTDAIADPSGSESFAVERLVRLPDGFLCYEPGDAPDVAPLPANRHGAVTFGSFSNLSKMTDTVLGLWADLLTAVPGARLVLKARALGDPAVRRDTLAIFERRGIAEDRLQFSGHIEGYRDHMAAYREIDIALDTFPYNGTTTICEALWMGVPTVTLRGDRHCARVGASLLTQVGVPDLIAATAEDYLGIAARLAEDRPRLAALRGGMRDRMRQSPLMDAPRFTANLETAYRELWRAWCAGKASA